jgi:hypothetical protein
LSLNTPHPSFFERLLAVAHNYFINHVLGRIGAIQDQPRLPWLAGSFFKHFLLASKDFLRINGFFAYAQHFGCMDHALRHN